MEAVALQNKNLWIIEDDEDCNFVYQQILDFRYKTRYFQSLKEFSRALEADPKNYPDLIIADIFVQDGNFLNFLRSASASRPLCSPFLVISSVDDIDVLRYCFSEGAIDYLTKPLKKNEILVKIEKIFAEKPYTKKKRVKKPDSRVNHEVVIDDQTIPNLTPKQYQMLKLFINSSDRCISRTDILQGVWGNTAVHPKTVDVHLYNLRRKLHNFGYMIRSNGGGCWTLFGHTL